MKINNLFNAGVYAAPSIEVAEFSVEQGFAASGDGYAGWSAGTADDSESVNDMGSF